MAERDKRLSPLERAKRVRGNPNYRPPDFTSQATEPPGLQTPAPSRLGNPNFRAPDYLSSNQSNRNQPPSFYQRFDQAMNRYLGKGPPGEPGGLNALVGDIGGLSRTIDQRMREFKGQPPLITDQDLNAGADLPTTQGLLPPQPTQAQATGLPPQPTQAQATGLPIDADLGIYRPGLTQAQAPGSPVNLGRYLPGPTQYNQGGTLSVLSGPSQEQRARTAQTVAGIESQIDALRALREERNPGVTTGMTNGMNGRAFRIGQDGGYGILSNSYEANRRARLQAADMPARYRADMYEKALAGNREAMGLPGPEERIAGQKAAANQQAGLLDYTQNLQRQQAEQAYRGQQLGLQERQYDLDRQQFMQDQGNTAFQQRLDTAKLMQDIYEGQQPDAGQMKTFGDLYQQGTFGLPGKNMDPFEHAKESYQRFQRLLNGQSTETLVAPNGESITMDSVLKTAQESGMDPTQVMQLLQLKMQ